MVFAFSALENGDESGRRLCEYWSTILQARIEGERHHCHETIFVQTALDDIRWETDRNEFDELMATKKRARSGPRWDSTWPLQMCEAWVLSFSTTRTKHVLEGVAISSLFAESRTVFNPKFSDIDNNGRIVLSPEALRPLTLCSLCIHPSQRRISSRQIEG